MPNVPNSAMAKIGEVHEREESVVEWTVRDFFSLPARVGGRYVSPLLSFAGAQWCLAVYPNGQKKNESEGFIDVRLVRETRGPPIELNCSLGLKTSKNEIAEELHGTRNFGKQYDYIGWGCFLKRSELRERDFELAPSGHLTWVCRLKRPPSTHTASAILSVKCAHCKESVDARSLPSHERKCLEKPIQCPDVVVLKHWYGHECQPAKSEGGSGTSEPVVTDKMLEDLNHPFLNRQNCDVILRVQGRKFQAHKLILTARSPVFASLLENDAKEKATAVVDIEDCNPSTFSDFLHFLYCQKADRLSEENVLSLLAAARKYGVADLKSKCFEFMKQKFNVLVLDDTVGLCHSENEPIELAVA